VNVEGLHYATPDTPARRLRTAQLRTVILSGRYCPAVCRNGNRFANPFAYPLQAERNTTTTVTCDGGLPTFHPPPQPAKRWEGWYYPFRGSPAAALLQVF
tara:strand:- start:22063 stop:22362 length:300 start_codon:yes stop_codon:yes gene_type:complete